MIISEITRREKAALIAALKLYVEEVGQYVDDYADEALPETVANVIAAERMLRKLDPPRWNPIPPRSSR